MLSRLSRTIIPVFLLFAAFPAAAQEFGPAMLPADTSLVIFTPGIAKVRAAFPGNPLAQVYASPEFDQLRKQVASYLFLKQKADAKGKPSKFTLEDLNRMFSLYESPMMIGMTGSADLIALAQSAPKSPGGFMKAAGLFFVLDVSGKSAEFDKLWPDVEAEIAKDETVTHSTFSGATIEKFTGSAKDAGSSFAARSGNYFIWSTQRKVLDDLITRLRPGPVAGKTLGDDPDFRQCRMGVESGPLYEVFFRIPDLNKIPIPPSPQFNFKAGMRQLHLDAMRAFYGSYALTADGGHWRGIVLGDTTGGGIVDLVGTNRGNFETLALAPASAYSVTAGSFDLQAFHKVILKVAAAGLPPEQQANVQMMEAMAAMPLGMSVEDALGLFGGEYAVMQFDAKIVSTSQLIAFTITDPEKFLSLVHKIPGDAVKGETKENGVTFLRLGGSAPAADPAQAPSPEYYLAITPHVLLAGSDRAMVREAASRLSGAPSAAGPGLLVDTPALHTLRAKLPHDVIGVNFTDYTRSTWLDQIFKSMRQAQDAGTAKQSPEDKQLMDSLEKLSMSIMGKMLHSSVATWWRAADGIHYEGFSQ